MPIRSRSSPPPCPGRTVQQPPQRAAQHPTDTALPAAQQFSSPSQTETDCHSPRHGNQPSHPNKHFFQKMPSVAHSLIQDRIVCGSSNARMRERLLREKTMTLDTCIQLCRASELSRKNVKTISGPKVEEVHAIQRPGRYQQPVDTVDCTFCGKSHERSKHKCPA